MEEDAERGLCLIPWQRKLFCRFSLRDQNIETSFVYLCERKRKRRKEREREIGREKMIKGERVFITIFDVEFYWWFLDLVIFMFLFGLVSLCESCDRFLLCHYDLFCIVVLLCWVNIFWPLGLVCMTELFTNTLQWKEIMFCSKTRQKLPSVNHGRRK